MQGELKEQLLHSYFADAQNPADRGVLIGAAVAVGLPEERVAAVLDSEEYADSAAADAARAAAYGATGVPFFVIDRTYGVSGAQPAGLFGQLLERARAESRSLVQVIGGEDADSCGPDGCPV
jgi:predicted DsbA family dithiol-disulfide isomerase